MDFGFENIIDFAMNIDKLILANLVREVDEIVEFIKQWVTADLT